MKHFVLIGWALLAQVAFAAPLEVGSKALKADLDYAVLSVEARCEGAKFEDDTSHVYFSRGSYPEVKAYQDRGYFMVTLSHFCGRPRQNETRKELSADVFETVRVLMVDTTKANQAIADQIKAAIDSF